MRHVNSVLLSLILAPAVWLLAGYGLVSYGRAGAQADGVIGLDRLVGLGALLLAAVLFATLLLSRLSPLGPALAGLAYLSAAGWVAGYPALASRTMHDLPYGLDAELIRPAEGFAVLLGLPLLATVLSTRRWRRFDGVPALYAPPDRVAEAPPVSPAAPFGSGPSGPGLTAPPFGSGPTWSGLGTPPDGGRPQGLTWPPFGTPVGRPAEPSRDADTADLTQALMPLRRVTPPPG